MTLHSYWSSSQQHANEILQMVTPDMRQRAYQTLTWLWPHPYLPIHGKRMRQALRLLGAQPARRKKQFQAAGEDRMLLWLDARYLALQATIYLCVAVDGQRVIGRKYRQATRDAAQSALQTNWELSPEQIALDQDLE